MDDAAHAPEPDSTATNAAAEPDSIATDAAAHAPEPDSIAVDAAAHTPSPAPEEAGPATEPATTPPVPEATTAPPAVVVRPGEKRWGVPVGALVPAALPADADACCRSYALLGGAVMLATYTAPANADDSTEAVLRMTEPGPHHRHVICVTGASTECRKAIVASVAVCGGYGVLESDDAMALYDTAVLTLRNYIGPWGHKAAHDIVLFGFTGDQPGPEGVDQLLVAHGRFANADFVAHTRWPRHVPCGLKTFAKLHPLQTCCLAVLVGELGTTGGVEGAAQALAAEGVAAAVFGPHALSTVLAAYDPSANPPAEERAPPIGGGARRRLWA